MFPTKSMADYMTEMNRLFPRSENDLLQSNAYSLAMQSPFNSTANRSSSSTDSTSPESFPEISVFKPDYNLRPIPETCTPVSATPPRNYEPRSMYDTTKSMYETPKSMFETPKSSENQFLIRPQRPIVGRKIFTETSPQTYERVQESPVPLTVTKLSEEYEFPASIWQDENRFFQHPPPNANAFIENKHYAQYYEPKSMYETPKSSETQFLNRQQRPTINKKNFTEPSPKAYERVQISPIPLPVLKLQQEYEFPTSIWHDENDGLFQQTPPFNHIFIENKKYTQNVYFELFPADNKSYEFKTPVKTSPTHSTHSNVSPMSNLSPHSVSHSPMGPNQNLYQRSLSFSSSSRPQQQKDEIGNQKMCTFCRKNGEAPVVYMTHMVKERIGNKFVVTCPILRKHVCSVCSASGDNAHTITYCPVLRSSNNGQPLQSTTVTLKNTRIKSNGRRRY